MVNKPILVPWGCAMFDENPNLAAALSEKQREVLELVVARYSSKEIARKLGISKHTVDQRITLARQKFGAASRNELVTRYLASQAICDRVAYDPAQVPESFIPHDIGAQGEQSGPIFSVADMAGFTSPFVSAEGSPLDHPLASLDRKFGVFGRLGAIGLLAALLAVSLVAMLSMAQTLSDLL